MGTLHRGTHFVLQPFLASGYVRLVRTRTPLGGAGGAGDKMHVQRVGRGHSGARPTLFHDEASAVPYVAFRASFGQSAGSE